MKNDAKMFAKIATIVLILGIGVHLVSLYASSNLRQNEKLCLAVGILIASSVIWVCGYIIGRKTKK